MEFRVIPNTARVPEEGRDVGYLWTDNWNDWFTYRTLYDLTYFDAHGTKHELGSLKIGQFDMKEKQDRPAIPDRFSRLSDRFFSLGQDSSYYARLRGLGDEIANAVMAALQDVVLNQPLLTRALSQDVMGTSLLRYVSLQTVTGQFRRILAGGAELTPYSFRYEGPRPIAKDENERLTLHFEVAPDSTPPTNIHVLIGRNGVGKTYLLQAMARALTASDEDPAEDGVFVTADEWEDTTTTSPFANLVSVSFSAFDDFPLLRSIRNVTKGKARYVSVGLRKRTKGADGKSIIITRAPADLAEEFSASAKLCVTGERLLRWQRALTTLQADPIFADAEVATLAETDEESFSRRAPRMYRRLSSGHKIVLLTITKLVETLEEKTLVIMDEPEAHLHPPLLSAFVRALSDLLINRNGVAIMATHSPVVLQEVPAGCVWKIIRHGEAARAARPTIETFAENVGVLTREVFGFEVTRSGFHKMLSDAVAEEESPEDVLARFGDQVGSEGRALVSGLLAIKEEGDEA